MIVSPGLSLMLTLGAVLAPPDGCAVVAVEEDGRAFATCTDPHTWFVYDPALIHGGLWSQTSYEPPGAGGATVVKLTCRPGGGGLQRERPCQSAVSAPHRQSTGRSRSHPARGTHGDPDLEDAA